MEGLDQRLISDSLSVRDQASGSSESDGTTFFQAPS